MPESELLWRGTALLGLGNEAVLDGSLRKRAASLMEAQALSGAVQNIHGVLAAVNILAEIDYLQGEMDQAAAEFQQVLADAVGGDEMLDDQSIAWLGLARICLRTQRPARRGRAGRPGFRTEHAAVERGGWVPPCILLAWVAQARGGSPGAGPAAGSPDAGHQPQMLRQLWIALARLAMAAGDLARRPALG